MTAHGGITTVEALDGARNAAEMLKATSYSVADMARPTPRGAATVSALVIEAMPTVRIDNGDPKPCHLKIEQDVVMIPSESAMKVDPAWHAVDTQGHFHAWAMDDGNPKTPTLNRETVDVPCDGSCGDEISPCDGYTVSRYTCRICDEEIEPHWVPDYQARNVGASVPGRKSAELQVDAGDTAPAYGQRVTLRVQLEEQELIGVGKVVALNSDGQVSIIAESLEARP